MHSKLLEETSSMRLCGVIHGFSNGLEFFTPPMQEHSFISLNKGRGKVYSVKIEILLTSREFKNQVNFGSWSEIVLKLTLLLPLLFHSHSAGKGGEQTATYHYIYLFEK